MSSVMTKSKFEYQRRLISECTENIQYITDSYNELPEDFDEYWEDSVIEFIDTPSDIPTDMVDKIRAAAKKRVLKLIHQKNELTAQVNDVISGVESIPDSPTPYKTSSAPVSPIMNIGETSPVINTGKTEIRMHSVSEPTTANTTPRIQIIEGVFANKGQTLMTTNTQPILQIVENWSTDKESTASEFSYINRDNDPNTGYCGPLEPLYRYY